MADQPKSDLKKYLRWGVIALAAALVLFVIYLTRTTFVILALSFFAAYILNPFIEKIEVHKISRFWSIWISTGLFLIITLLIFFIIVPQVNQQIRTLQKRGPEWIAGLQSYTQTLLTGDATSTIQIPSAADVMMIGDDTVPAATTVSASTQSMLQSSSVYQKNILPILESINKSLVDKPMEETSYKDYAEAIWGQIKVYQSELWNSFWNAIQTTYQGVTGFIIGVLNLIILPVFTFYFLLDYKRIHRGFYDLMPPRWRVVVKDWLTDIDGVLGNFIRGQFLIACILALIYSVGLSILQVPMGAVIGIIAGMANMVPYMSVVIGLVPAILFALLEDPNIVTLIWILILFFGGQLFEGLYLNPRILSEEVGLHPVAIIVSIIVGGSLFGLAGILLAVPVTAILKVIFIRLHSQWKESWETEA